MNAKTIFAIFTAFLGLTTAAQAGYRFECKGKDSNSQKPASAALEIHADKTISGEVYGDDDELATFERERSKGTRNFGRDRFTAYQVSEDGYGGYTYVYIATKQRKNGSFPVLVTITRYSEAGLHYSNYVRLICAQKRK